MHLCYNQYWGDAAVDLYDILNNIAPGEAVDMKQQSTYWTLCIVQREIERATGMHETPIPAWTGRGTAFSDDTEAHLRATAQQFLNALVSDQYDEAGPGHHGLKKNKKDWMSTAGTPQAPPSNPPDALVVLRGPPPPLQPPPANAPLASLLGKVRNSLGS